MGSKSLFHNGRTYFTCVTNEGERKIAKLASQWRILLRFIIKPIP